MYAVVGCNNCSALWVVEGRPETTECPRCAKRHRFQKLKQFHSTTDPDQAKQARAAMLADRQGQSEAFANLDDFAAMERSLDDAGVGDETYLQESGIDTEEVAAAAERADSGTSGSRTRQEILRDAIRTQDEPTENEVLDYASEHGVPREKASDLLEKMVRSGEASRSRGVYRLL